MSTQGDMQLIQGIIDGLNRNPVARFSYTQDAFDQDIVDGVELFDHTAGQNIPKAVKTDYNPTIIDKGVRTQGASIPRMGWNHYVGRLSYNLNKTVQKLFSFFGIYRATLAHNANEYDSSAQYKKGDICYSVEEVEGIIVYTWYQRISSSPEFISNIPPSADMHWSLVYERSSLYSYQHKFSIIDLSGSQYLSGVYYPVTVSFQNYNTLAEGAKESTLQVRIEAYCRGQVGRTGNVCRIELSLLSKFTGFVDSSTDILFNHSFIDAVTGAARDPLTGPIGFSKLIKGKQAVLWLRGGAKYGLWNSYGSNFTLRFSQYDNGVDSILTPLTYNTFALTFGRLKAKLKTVTATEPDDAVPFSQINGAVPLPKELEAGNNLRSVRTPGQYLALQSNVANSISELPVSSPGPFELLVSGDKAGLTITTQRIIFRQSGDEYTRILLGQIVIVDWYLSASPRGTNITVTGLYCFNVVNGNLVMFYRDGDSVPDFHINEDGELEAEIA